MSLIRMAPSCWLQFRGLLLHGGNGLATGFDEQPADTGTFALGHKYHLAVVAASATPA
ncbi:MAG TPA: hypothetical protein VIG92_07990 [Rhodospirillales bacterium]